MLELYKGQLDVDSIMHNKPYKEVLLLRDVRIERLKREKDELEKERAEEAKKQAAEAARNKIHISKR